MELTYTKVEGHYIPNLTLGDQPDKSLGRYGRMHQKFLKEYHPGTYVQLILSGKLWAHLLDIDIACEERMNTIIPAIAKWEGVTEALKAADQMAWVGQMTYLGGMEMG